MKTKRPRGRPKLPENEVKKVYPIRISDKVKNKLKEKAAKRGVSLWTFINDKLGIK